MDLIQQKSRKIRSSPFTYLKRNFFLDTLWLSIFVNHPWSFCNRSARITLATMTVSMAAVSNLMFYKDEIGPQVEIGPLRFSPSILYVNFITSIMTAVPAFIFTIVFNNTAPKSLAHVQSLDVWKYSRVIRPLGFIACTMISMISFFFAILYALMMEKSQVQNWVGAQLFANICDITIAPILIILTKSIINYFFNFDLNKGHLSYFIHEQRTDLMRKIYNESPLQALDNIVRLPNDIKQRDDNKVAKVARRQRHEMKKTIQFTLGTILMTTCYFIISQTILPSEKYWIGLTYREQLPVDKMVEVSGIWSFIDEYIVNMNFPSDHDNGEPLSSTERKMSGDNVNFRVGPARLFQLRHVCDYYASEWVVKNKSNIAAVEYESPLRQPWFVLDHSNIPRDWRADTVPSFGDCHYEAELGNTRKTSITIIDSLKEGAWIDNQTTLLFFEQTFFNGNTNSFSQVRLSFEHVNGGAFHSQLRINQFQYEHENDSNLYFYAYCFFVVQYAFNFGKLINYILKKKISSKSMATLVFLIFDTILAYNVIHKIIETAIAVEQFQLSPRSRPPFDELFYYQSSAVSTIAVVLYCHTLHLIVVFASVNMVKIYFDVLRTVGKKLIGWLLFMIPFTFGFAIFGMMFLNWYSAEFKSVFTSVKALIVFGYLKPNNLRYETDKGSNPTILNIYQLSYLLLAALIIVNFFVSIINDSHTKANTIEREEDILAYVSNRFKAVRRRRTSVSLQNLYNKSMRRLLGYNGKERTGCSDIASVIKEQ